MVTVDWQLMGTAFEGVEDVHELLPTVTLHEAGDVCRYNFGSEAFRFDVAAYAKEPQRWGEVVGGGRIAGPHDELEDLN